MMAVMKERDSLIEENVLSRRTPAASLALEAASVLAECGIESARVNAESILCGILGCAPIDLYVGDIRLSREQACLMDSMMKRRINGEPLQHITGRVNFYGNELVVKKGVFIPRPETEILVDTVIKEVTGARRHPPTNPGQATHDAPLYILDLCTGSGNIAISLTKALPRCKITASDISDTALETAADNAQLNSVSGRIDFINADLLDIPERYANVFDIIVSNPPYISSKGITGLRKEVKRDPVEALDGGIDGMDFYRRIAETGCGFLKDNGILAMELAGDLSREIKKLIEDTGYYTDIEIFKDLNGIERVIRCRIKIDEDRKPNTENRIPK